MFGLSSRFTPALNAQVYAIRRSPSTTVRLVVDDAAGDAPVAQADQERAARRADHRFAGGRATTGFRHAVAFGSPGLTGNLPVIAGDVTCVVSYRNVGAITGCCASVARMASGWYW